MSERRVGLDSGLPSALGKEAGMGAGTSQGRDPRADEVERFQGALAAASADRAKATGEAAAPQTSLFSLFGGVAASPATPVEVDWTRIAESTHQWLVESKDRRAVRFALDDDLIPGSALTLFEEAGQLKVQFEVDNAASAALVEAEGAQFASAVAGRLNRPVTVELCRDGGCAAAWEGLPG